MKLTCLLLVSIALTTVDCHPKETKHIISFYPNGRAQEVRYYSKEQDTGTYRREFFYENGIRCSAGSIVNGEMDGRWTWWFDNGTKKDEATLQKGVYVGTRSHWRKNGTIKQKEIITGPCYGDCCDGMSLFYYENGTVQSEQSMKGGQLEGKYIYRYDNGQAKKQEYFRAGIKQGTYQEWYRDGTKWVTGYFKDDKQDSAWTWFDSTGKASSVELFKAGKELIK
jgi:antitoxin component YwqK of YwqJK toxin-antitoxin module